MDVDLFGNPIKKEPDRPTKADRVTAVVVENEKVWDGVIRPCFIEKVDSTHTIIWNR